LINKSHCIVCGSNNIEALFKLRDYRLDDRINIYHYDKCQNCGLIFQNPQIPLDTIIEHYNQNKIYNSSVSTKGINKFLNSFGLHKRASIILKKKKTGRLLDIGCGSGAFINYLANKSQIDVIGTEINHEYVNELTIKKGLDVRLGNLNEIGFSKDEFDIITMWDVIEHVIDPNKILIDVRKVLKSNGFLVIRVPNGDSLDFKLFGKYWAGLDAPRHYYVFTEESLQRLLKSNGFIIVSSSYHIGGYLNAITSLEFFLNDLIIPLKIKEFVLKILRSPILQVVFFPLHWLKAIFTKGTSITITARPSRN